MQQISLLRKRIYGLFSQKYLVDSYWLIVGSVVTKVMNFLTIAWIARILGPDNFGAYNVIQSTVGMFGTFAGLGLGLAGMKLIAEYKERDILRALKIINALYFVSIIVGVFVALVFFVTSELISNNVLGNATLVVYLQITSLIVIFDSITGVQNGVMAGFGYFKEVSIISVITSIISTPLMVLSTTFYGLFGLTIVLLFWRMTIVVANEFFLRKKIASFNAQLKICDIREVLRDILLVGAPSFFSGLSTNGFGWVTTSIFVNQPGNYKALGIFNSVNQLRSIVTFLPENAGRVTMPDLVNSFSNQEFVSFRKTVFKTFVWNLLMSVLPAVVLLFFGASFNHFLGDKFQITSVLILVVVITGVIISVSNALGYVFICSDLIWYDFYLRIFWGITVVLIMVLYGQENGAFGYGVSILGAYISQMIAQMVILFVKLRPIYRQLK